MKNIEELLKQLEEGRRDDKLLLNIIYYLIKTYKFSKSIRNITIEDLEVCYDNLDINNEIITSDNYEDYDFNELKKIYNCNINNSTIAKIKEGKKILLLNYYDINDNLVECRISLDNIDDKLIF